VATTSDGWIACYEKCRLAGVVRGGGADDPHEVEKLTDKLTQAYKMGKNV